MNKIMYNLNNQQIQKFYNLKNKNFKLGKLSIIFNSFNSNLRFLIKYSLIMKGLIYF